MPRVAGRVREFLEKRYRVVIVACMLVLAVVVASFVVAQEAAGPVYSSSVAAVSARGHGSVWQEVLAGKPLVRAWNLSEYSSCIVVGYRGEEPQFYRVEVRVAPGNGSVIVEGVGFDETFRYSTETAAFLAALVAGYDPWSLDYYVRFEPLNGSFSRVSGPSASPQLYVAFLQALGVDVARHGDAVSTGMVSLDGLVGAVGGIEVKARGALMLGSPLVYGLGSEYELERGCNVSVVGPFVYTDCGVVKKRIHVENGSTIISVFEYAGLNATNTSIGDVLRRLHGNSTCGLLEEYIDYLVSLIGQASSGLGSLLSLLAEEEPELYESVSEAMNRVLFYVVEAQEASSKGYCFVAVEYYSHALSEVIKLYSLLGVNGYGVARDYTETLRELAHRFLGIVSNETSAMSSGLLASYAYARALIERGDREFSVLDKIDYLLRVFGIRQEFVRAGVQTCSRAMVSYSRSIAMLVAIDKLLKDKTLQGNTSMAAVRSRVREFTRLVEDTVYYSVLVSVYGKTRSSIPGLAHAEIRRAEYYLSRNETLIALNHAVQSLAYALTFFALHPGVEEVWAKRLPYVVLASLIIGDPYGLPQLYYVERILYGLDRGVEDSTLLYEAEHLYAWSLVTRLLLHETSISSSGR